MDIFFDFAFHEVNWLIKTIIREKSNFKCNVQKYLFRKGGSARIVHVHKGGCQPNAHSMHTWGEGGSKKAEILHTYYVHSP